MRVLLLLYSIFVLICFSISGPVADKLNVHIVPHTHDDVGWLKTVDQYFYGANNSIQNAAVQFILDSVTHELDGHPERKFIYVESAFFKRWWDEQPTDIKTKVRDFVKNGQLEFINGGWCMHDEAAPNYVDMIDQTTLGHQFLLKEFGTVPTIGWQIDPFGHSATQASLYALMGMNAWFFGRIDYQDRAVREKMKTTEVIMRGSPSLGKESDIFTGVMRGYGPPGGFHWELGSHDPPIMDDLRLEDYNVKERVELFVNRSLDQHMAYRTNNIMFSFGTDFNYQNAHTWYKNIDKLIKYVNADGRVNAFYSTPSIYLKAKHDANISWPTKEDDWFPYADHLHAFWTGYFTSRPALKGYVRSTSNYLQICRQLELQSTKKLSVSSEPLWEAMSVAQHHDAVSGTSKQHVANDYALRLSKGSGICKEVIDEVLNQIVTPNVAPSKWYECPLLNESKCGATTDGGSAAFVAYNPLSVAREEYVQFPYLLSTKVNIVGPTGHAVPVDFVPLEDSTTLGKAVFQVSMPPMGYSMYIFNVTKKLPTDQKENSQATKKNVQDTMIENKFYQLTFSDADGKLVSIKSKLSGVSTKLVQDWGWYNSSDGNVDKNNNRHQASGAYIFRPNCTENTKVACDPFPTGNGKAHLTITKGNGVQIARQSFANWVVQEIRLYSNADFIEVEYTVGPIPFKDNLGKEIVSIWRTDIATKKTFYTDSNGRDMQKRVINYRPTWSLNVTDPVSGNFYPVNHAISIRDSTRHLSIMTDRSHSGSSLRDGEIQLMVHRRTLYDDRRGVGEPINETGVSGKRAKFGEGLVVTGTQRVTFDNASESPKLRRKNQDRLTFGPHFHFTPFRGTLEDWLKTHMMTYSGVNDGALPSNLHLLSAHDNSLYGAEGTMILRIAHQYEVDEDPEMSKPSVFDLQKIFKHISLTSCEEMSLTANQKLSDVNRYTWKTETEFSSTRQNVKLASTINPMQIKTFQCSYKHM